MGTPRATAQGGAAGATPPGSSKFGASSGEWRPLTMLNRRQFVYATAACAAAFARVTDVLAAAPKYDLIIKGGRVIDPSLRIDAIRDVAIAGGRIEAVEANLGADAMETIDARGKAVV